jgi:hypothetical protein
MTYNCSKLSKYSLVAFLIFSQLVGCGCKKGSPAEGSSGSDHTNTSGGESSGAGNPDGGNSGTGNPGVANSGVGNPGTGGNSGTGNPGVANPGVGNPGTGGKAITEQRIQELLEGVEKDTAAIERIKDNLQQFLKELKNNSKISEADSRTYLRCAIEYKNDDIVTLAVDNLKGDINEAFIVFGKLKGDINKASKNRTFLEWAIYYGNDHAKNLLIQKGAK